MSSKTSGTNVATATVTVNADTSDFEKNIGRVKTRFYDITTVGSGVLSAFVTEGIKKLGELAKEVIDVGVQFDSAMSKVQAISGATGEDMTKLTAKAKEMGETTKFTASESADAFTYMAMAGWKTEEMLDGIEGIMNLAAASGADLATTSDIVTDALTAMGYGAKDAGHFADVMAKASSNANTNVELMGETFQYAAPLAGALGYNIEDTAVAIGLMANSGIKGSQAGTTLRSVLSRLADPTEEMTKAMEELGISLVDERGQMKSLNTVMTDMRKAFKNLNEVQKTEYASTIAGKNAMSGLLAIVNGSEADFQKLTNAVKNSNGAAKEMADTMLDNVGGKMTLLSSKFEGLLLDAYEGIKPFLNVVLDFASGLIDVARGIGEFINGVGQVVGGFFDWVTGANNVSEAQKELLSRLEADSKAAEADRESWEKLTAARQDTVDKGMSELKYYDDLATELGEIIDENGKVQDGYEKRATFITTRLQEALGVEIELQDNVVQGYENIKRKIDEVIKKKRAEIILQSQEALYTEALTKRQDVIQRLNDLNKERAELEGKTGFAARTAIDTINKAYNEQLEYYKEYSYNIMSYEDNLALFTEGKYGEMATTSWEYVKNLQDADDIQRATLEQSRAETALELNIIKEEYEKTGWDIYKNQIDSKTRQLGELDDQLAQYKSKTSEGLSQTTGLWASGLAEQLSVATGKTWEFRDMGYGLVQAYADGESQGTPVAESALKSAIDEALKGARSELRQANDIGENIPGAVSTGINNGAWGAYNTAGSFASGLFERVKSVLGIHSPSKLFRDEVGAMLAKGLGIGFEDEMDEVSKDMAEAIPASFSGAVMDIPESSATRVDRLGYSLSDIYENEALIETGSGVSIGEQKFIVNNGFDAREAGRQFIQEIRRLA